jgi:hypothetical protein
MIQIKIVGFCFAKTGWKAFVKKMPLGPQFAQGPNRGIKAEVPNRGPVYSPAECAVSISKKFSEKLNCQGQCPLTIG